MCAVVIEVFNTNPSSSKHIFILKVEQVLKYLGSMKTNEQLSVRFLILKLTVLFSLTSAGSNHETACLDVRYMIEKENSSVFYFSKIIKS